MEFKSKLCINMWSDQKFLYQNFLVLNILLDSNIFIQFCSNQFFWLISFLDRFFYPIFLLFQNIFGPKIFCIQYLIQQFFGPIFFYAYTFWDQIFFIKICWSKKYVWTEVFFGGLQRRANQVKQAGAELCQAKPSLS